jgi:hypothetical protein
MKNPIALEFTVNLKTLSLKCEIRRLAPKDPRQDWRATSISGRSKRKVALPKDTTR